ncbi:unnamed protein product [Closterium sp. NIES-54]
MTSLCRSGGGGDGGGGGTSGGGQQRQRESLTPQQLREWCTSRGGGGGSSGTPSAAVQLGVPGGGLTHQQRHPHETLTPQQLREWYVQRGVSPSSTCCPYVIRTGDRAGQTCGTVGHTQSHCFSCLSDTWRAEFGDATELPQWLELVRQRVDIFALDYDAILTAMYALSASAEGDCSRPCTPSVGGECALGTDVLEDGQEDFECLAAAVPRFASMLLAPEGDPDAPKIPTPRSYAEAITGPYSSQWQATMDAKMASWKSTGTYVDEVPLPGANIVDGMWIFRVKWLPGSPPAFKARYVARGFSQRQGVDYF